VTNVVLSDLAVWLTLAPPRASEITGELLRFLDRPRLKTRRHTWYWYWPSADSSAQLSVDRSKRGWECLIDTEKCASETICRL